MITWKQTKGDDKTQHGWLNRENVGIVHPGFQNDWHAKARRPGTTDELDDYFPTLDAAKDAVDEFVINKDLS